MNFESLSLEENGEMSPEERRRSFARRGKEQASGFIHGHTSPEFDRTMSELRDMFGRLETMTDGGDFNYLASELRDRITGILKDENSPEDLKDAVKTLSLTLSDIEDAA